MTDKKLAEKIIKELDESGLDYDQQLEVIKLARENLKYYQNI